MRVLVTGGAGFIGSHIVDALVERGVRPAVIDNLSTGKLSNIRHDVTFYRGDLGDAQFISDCLLREQPSVIIHQAAQVSVPVSLKDPAGDAAVNVVGTINLLEAARRAGTVKVVYASSAAVYGTPEYLPVDESHPVAPLSGYGVSKHTVEHYLALYREMYSLDYTVLRYANVYGPRQDAAGEGGVVAVFVDRMLAGDKPVIFGDGEQTRDFVHVEDVARANMGALDRGSGLILNVSTGRPVTVNRLFRIIKEAAGYRGEPGYGPARAGDIRDSILDCRMAGSALGWQAALGLDQGIRKTVQEWCNNQGRSRIL